MDKLFNISADFVSLFNQFEDIQNLELQENDSEIDIVTAKQELEQSWFEMLTAIETQFEEKASNVAQYIKHLKANATAIKSEEDRLRKRRQAYERSAESLVAYLKQNMQAVNLKKIETPLVRITLKNNAPSLKIKDEQKFIEMLERGNRDDLLKYSAPEIHKNEVKKLIKSGEEFEGAVLESSQSVIIS